MSAAPTGAAERLTPICGPLEVAIGISVAYLGFDRFRYHQRARDILNKIAKAVAPPQVLLDKMLSDGLTQVERDFLAALFHCGDADTIKLIEPHKPAVLDGEMMKSWLGLAMSWILKKTIDRFAVQIILVILLAIELFIAWAVYVNASLPSWLNGTWVGDLIFVVILLAIVVPALAFCISEWMLSDLRSARDRWVREEKTRQERGAKEAAIQGLAAPGRP
jgi:hypothetical protein